jgi:hypothetical protein
VAFLAGRIVGAAELTALGFSRGQMGSVPVTISSGTSFGTAVVTFPVAFAAVPTVSAVPVSSAIGSGFKVGLIVRSVTTTTMEVRVDLSANVSSTVTPSVHWMAFD